MTRSAIQVVLENYFPTWEAPDDDGKTWTSCLCPSHLEARESCAISYELEAVKCQACDFGGDLVGIVRMMEGEECSFGDAVRKAEEILVGSGVPIPDVPPWIARRGVPARKGALGRKPAKPGTGLRGRTPPGT